MIHSIKDKEPKIANDTFIAWSAEVCGDVELAEGANIWYGAVLRADVDAVKIGRNSNVQDNATVHVDFDAPTIVGENVTIGHNAVLHGCVIGDNSLIGMGAIVLNNAKIGNNCVVGAGSLVTEGKEFPDNSLIIGSPAKAVRQLRPEEIEKIKANAELYLQLADDAKNKSKEIKL